MAKIKSQTAVIKIGDGASPETFNAIGSITDISGPGLAADPIDVTDLDSTEMEFLDGLPDHGEISISGIYDPSDTYMTQLRTALTAGTLTNFKIVESDGSTTHSFAAYVSAWGPLDRSVGARVGFAASLRVSGAVTTA